MPEVGGGVEKGKGVQPLDDPHNRNGGKVLTPCDWSVATPFTHTDPCAANAPVPFFCLFGTQQLSHVASLPIESVHTQLNREIGGTVLVVTWNSRQAPHLSAYEEEKHGRRKPKTQSGLNNI